MKRYRVTRSRF